MSLSAAEIFYAAIEVSAQQAAFDAFEDRQRGGLGRGLEPDDELDAARDRLGGPGQRAKAFFESLNTADLQMLTAVYYASRDWRTNYDDPSEIDPEKELRSVLSLTTRSGTEVATREECLRKLLEVAGSNKVFEFVDGYRRFGAAAEKIRGEFAVF